MFSNSSTTQIPNTQSLSIASVSVLMMLCCLAILENIFTCYLICTNKILHTATNTFIFSLCITDILCAGVLVPIAVFCKGSTIYLYLSGMTVFTYAANLMAVTYERLISITKPLQYRSIVTKKKALRITLAAWIIPILYCLLPITWETNTQSLEHKIFLLFALLIFLVAPLFFICFVYVRIFFEVHRLLKDSRHLVVYSLEDDSEAATETVFQRLQNSCFSMANNCNWRVSCRKDATKKRNRAMEDSNDDETSQTCKSELCTSTFVHESPRVPDLQNRCQKHVTLRSCQKKREDDTECCKMSCLLDKSIEESKGMIAANQEIAHESAQDNYMPITRSKNLQVKTIAQVTSNQYGRKVNECDTGMEDCKHQNADRICDMAESACYDAIVVIEKKCSPNSLIGADTICREDERRGERCTRKAEKSAFATSEEDPSIKEILLSCDDGSDKGNKKIGKSKQGVSIKRRKRSCRRQQIFDEIRATTAFAAVAFTYMFTWIPVIYMTLMEAINKAEMIPQTIDDANMWTIALNATIDPLFYALILRNFRKVIKKKFRKLRNKYN